MQPVAPAATVCKQMNAATGACEITEDTYTCPVLAPGNRHHGNELPGQRLCLAGNCFDTSYTNDADFRPCLMSLMEAAREAGGKIPRHRQHAGLQGRVKRCRDRLFKNCCYSDSAGAGMTNQSLFGTGSRLVYDVLMNADNREFLYRGMQALLFGGGFSGTFTTYGVTVAINGAALPAGSAVPLRRRRSGDRLRPLVAGHRRVIYIVMSMSSCNEDEGKLAMKEGPACAKASAPIVRRASAFSAPVSPASSTPPASAASTASSRASSTSRAACRWAGLGLRQEP